LTLIPNIVIRKQGGLQSMDVYSALLSERIVFLGTDVNDTSANTIVAQLLHLAAADPKKDISIYINSPGGSITALFAIYDTMQYISAPITTLCIGQAASAAAVILSGGTKGKRLILPNSRVLLHQPSGGAQGQASDIEIQAREVMRMRERLNHILADNCSQPLERIEQDLDRDYILTAEAAKEYGIVDHIVYHQEETSE
jgi:ATP-dependent Clp protease protease subunit